MDLKELEQNWDIFGEVDPLWAILSNPSKKNGKWDVNDFFRTGNTYIDWLMKHIASLKKNLPRRRALDFGCGVGRLTQGLCRYFDESIGIDIASSMIENAKHLNRFGNRCKYYVNTRDDLSLFEANSFDFICTIIVLQHIEPVYTINYLREFLRILRPDGTLAFQLPSHRLHGRAVPADQIQVSPLPDEAFKAEISIVGNVPVTLVANSDLELNVAVANRGSVTWPRSEGESQVYPINLGNHWLDDAGNVLVNDDARSPLSVDLGPNESFTFAITVHVPVRAGQYRLEFDMVQEKVAWFKNKHSPTSTRSVTVQAPDQAMNIASAPVQADKLPKRCKALGAENPVLLPRMEMHGIPAHEVLEMIQSFGGDVIDMRSDAAAGEDWLSYLYCVVKARR